MTIRRLFEGAFTRLMSAHFGTKITGQDGVKKDTGVQQLAEEVAAILSSEKPIKLSGPLEFDATEMDGPAMILEIGDNSQGIMLRDSNGSVSTFGIGLGNHGIVANEFYLDPAYRLDPDIIRDLFERFRDEYSPTPAQAPPYIPDIGTGYRPSGPSSDGDDSNTGGAGSGNTGGTGYPLNNQPASDATFPGMGPIGVLFPNIYDIIPGVRSFTIDEVKDDYLVCTMGGSDRPFDVAKPYNLRKTPFDGQTINGITYDYDLPDTRSDTRQASDGTDTEDQHVEPPYEVGDPIYGQLIVNGTGLQNDDNEDIYWLDTNVDARLWVSDPDCT